MKRLPYVITTEEVETVNSKRATLPLQCYIDHRIRAALFSVGMPFPHLFFQDPIYSCILYRLHFLRLGTRGWEAIPLLCHLIFPPIAELARDLGIKKNI